MVGSHDDNCALGDQEDRVTAQTRRVHDGTRREARLLRRHVASLS
jgi:hypothetical protein